MLSTFITGAVIAVLVFYVIVIYNNLVRLKHNVSQAWSNIDVILRQRHEELPKLVETCRQYMQHEREVLERVTQARAAVSTARETGSVAALGTAETAMRAGLASLFAVAENYPDLKADRTFQHLQTRISQLESQIADRREYYNDAVNLNNIRIEQFPDNLLAARFGFGPRELLAFSEEEKADVDVKALFGR